MSSKTKKPTAPKWFKGMIYTKGETVTNPFSGESYDLTGLETSIYDFIIGCQMVFDAIEKSWGGELFVPKIPSYKIVDVATAIGPDCRQDEVGIRPGEKLHEEMITVSDATNTYDIGKYYVILPQVTVFDKEEFVTHFNAKKVNGDFSYNISVYRKGPVGGYLSVEDEKDVSEMIEQVKGMNPEKELRIFYSKW